MTMTPETYTHYRDYVDRLGNLIHEARPSLMGCVFVIMDNEELEYLNEIERRQVIEGDWYVKLVCENGYCYWINVTAENLLSVAESVLRLAVYK